MRKGQRASRAGAGLAAAPAFLAGLALALLAAPLLRTGVGHAADPNALWEIVGGKCAPDMKANGKPAPCAAVNLAQGSAVLRDIRGATQYLLIPTTRVTGIEDPQILQPASPNYWQAAWDARSFVEKLAGRPIPRQDLVLAVNSPFARSQNQLHIHIDCIRPDVLKALTANVDNIGATWAPLDVPLAGHRYRALRLEGDTLGPRDPFKLLADGDPQARADMAHETLALVGVTAKGGAPGFVLLSDRADPASGDRGHAEGLQDHDCAVLHG